MKILSFLDRISGRVFLKVWSCARCEILRASLETSPAIGSPAQLKRCRRTRASFAISDRGLACSAVRAGRNSTNELLSQRHRLAVVSRLHPGAGTANNTLAIYEFENVLISNLPVGRTFPLVSGGSFFRLVDRMSVMLVGSMRRLHSTQVDPRNELVYRRIPRLLSGARRILPAARTLYARVAKTGFPSMFCGRASDLAANVCGHFLSVGSRPGYHRARSDQISGEGFNEYLAN